MCCVSFSFMDGTVTASCSQGILMYDEEERRTQCIQGAHQSAILNAEVFSAISDSRRQKPKRYEFRRVFGSVDISHFGPNFSSFRVFTRDAHRNNWECSVEFLNIRIHAPGVSNHCYYNISADCTSNLTTILREVPFQERRTTTEKRKIISGSHPTRVGAQTTELP